MPIVTRHSSITVAVLALASLLIVGGVIWFGMYNIAADDPHTRPVYSMLQVLRERSITARSRDLHPPPNLSDPARIRQGAGNYNAMCTGCHLSPGMAETELSQGLYPAPPNLSKGEVDNPAHHFWVIKHGIKASGMPAWGKSMNDEYIWNMVAFLGELPQLDAAQYQAMVADSGGHAHGGGETGPRGMDAGKSQDHDAMPMDAPAPHADAPGTPPHEDSPADAHGGMAMGDNARGNASPTDAHAPGTPADHHAAAPLAKPAPKSTAHRHADGTVEPHPKQ